MKPVAGFERYAVSEEGFVYRIKTRVDKPCDPRPVKGSLNSNGYLAVALRKDGKTYTRLVHRLVAAAYLGDPTDYDVCHWNHKRDDNRVENLYIGTRQENCKQSGDEGRYGHWRKGVAPATKKLNDVMVAEIKKKYATRKYKQVDLAAEYGISQSLVSLVCRA